MPRIIAWLALAALLTPQLASGQETPLRFVSRALDELEWEQALASANQLLRKNPFDDRARVHRASALEGMGELDRAEDELNFVLQIHPDAIDALIVRSKLHISVRNDMKAAALDIDRVSKLQPKNARVVRLRAWQLEALDPEKNFDAILALLEEAIRCDPNDANTYSGRCLLNADKKRLDAARQDLEHAVKLDAELDGYLRALVLFYSGEYERACQIWEGMIGSPNKSIRQSGHIGMFAYFGNIAKDYGRASQHLAEDVRLQPTPSRARLLGQFYFQLRRFDLAQEAYSAAIRMVPRDAQHYVGRAACYVRMNEANLAIADLAKALELDKNVNLYGVRGELYRQEKDYEKAVVDLSEAIRRNPDDVNFRFHRGRAYQATKDFDKALGDFDEIVRLFPKKYEGYILRAEIHLARNDKKRAAVEVESARKHNPKAVEELEAESALNVDPEKAIEILNNDILAKPNDSEAYLTRALFRIKQSRFDLAVADCDKAIELDPKVAEAYVRRAFAHFGLGESDKAIADCDRAISLSPPNASALQLRGQSYLQKRQLAKAEADFDEALRLDPEFRDVLESRAMLWDLRGETQKAAEDRKRAKALGERRVRRSGDGFLVSITATVPSSASTPRDSPAILTIELPPPAPNVEAPKEEKRPPLILEAPPVIPVTPKVELLPPPPAAPASPPIETPPSIVLPPAFLPLAPSEPSKD